MHPDFLRRRHVGLGYIALRYHIYLTCKAVGLDSQYHHKQKKVEAFRGSRVEQAAN